jgi:Helix-turn-helix
MRFYPSRPLPPVFSRSGFTRSQGLRWARCIGDGSTWCHFGALLVHSFTWTVPAETAVSCSSYAYPPVPGRATADPVALRFGARVREASKQRGETLEQVAHRIMRMDARHLGEIERGWHAPTLPTAKRIANALEMKLAELVRDL